VPPDNKPPPYEAEGAPAAVEDNDMEDAAAAARARMRDDRDADSRNVHPAATDAAAPPEEEDLWPLILVGGEERERDYLLVCVCVCCTLFGRVTVGV